jgi:hypothetical protein
MGKMPVKKKADDIVWESCRCGCGGMETLYRGRYFWKYWGMGHGHDLYSEHNRSGFHVGAHRFRNLTALEEAIRKEYRKYPKMEALPWRRGDQPYTDQLTVHLKKIQFFVKVDNALWRRVSLSSVHNRTWRQHGFLRMPELDAAVRKIARRMRQDIPRD